MAANLLLSSQTSDGEGSVFDLVDPCTIIATGVLDGAEVLVKASVDGGSNYVIVAALSNLTPENVNLFGSYKMKAELKDAGTSTSVTVYANQ